MFGIFKSPRVSNKESFTPSIGKVRLDLVIEGIERTLVFEDEDEGLTAREVAESYLTQVSQRGFFILNHAYYPYHKLDSINITKIQ
jgi:hypothetical protein